MDPIHIIALMIVAFAFVAWDRMKHRHDREDLKAYRDDANQIHRERMERAAARNDRLDQECDAAIEGLKTNPPPMARAFGPAAEPWPAPGATDEAWLDDTYSSRSMASSDDDDDLLSIDRNDTAGLDLHDQIYGFYGAGDRSADGWFSDHGHQ